MAENITTNIELNTFVEVAQPRYDLNKSVFPYLWAVLVFEIIVQVFEMYLNFRQYKKYCEKEQPKEIRSIVTEEQFQKSQSHNKDKMEFNMLREYLDLLSNSIWMVFKLPVWLWAFSVNICEFVGLNPEDDTQRTLAYLGFIHIYNVLHSIPWSLYSTFVISERHGFNKQTIGLFVKDQIKTLFLVVLIGGPFIYLILEIIEWGGENFYIYVFVFMLAFQIIMMHIFPNYIQPLYNKFTELPEGELRTKIYALAERLNFPLKKLFIVDESSRSAHSNAYFFGFGNDKRIVLYDTLQKQCTNDEIVAILGHELGHWSKNHTIQQLVITQTFMGLYIFIKMYQPVSFVINYLMVTYMRKLEFEADQFSMDLGYGNLLAEALIKIHVENASNMNPDFYYANYHYHHPIMIERLKAMKYDKPFAAEKNEQKEEQEVQQNKKED